MKFAPPLMVAAACLLIAAGADAKPARKAKPPAPKPAPAETQVAPEETAPVDAGTAEVGDPQPQGIESVMPPVEAAPSDAAPAEAAPATIKLPAPAMKAGDKRRFRIVSVDETRGPNGVQSRESDQTVEIEVIKGRGETRTLRYAIVGSAVKNDPLGEAMLRASQGVATDFEADASGKPLKLTEWDKVRATILERLLVDPKAPLDGAKRTRTALTSMDGVMAIPFAVPEVLMMADMQNWPEMAPGRTDEPPAMRGTGDSQARLNSYREAALPSGGGCTVALKRVTELDPQSPLAKARAAIEKLETTAEVSTVDGWVVRLKQTNNQLAGSNRHVRTWTITREDPPECPVPAAS